MASLFVPPQVARYDGKLAVRKTAARPVPTAFIFRSRSNLR
jgi:hypothetical protein